MNCVFQFHTAVDAVSNTDVYQRIKRDVSFSQGSVSNVIRLRWTCFAVGLRVNFFSCIQHSKIIKIERIFPQFMMTDVLPPFDDTQCVLF